MQQAQEDLDNFIAPKKVSETPNRLRLIYLAILALGIPLESRIIPISKLELDLVIDYLARLLQNYEELIRRACSLVEQQAEIPPAQRKYYGLVKEYLERFSLLSTSEEFLPLNLSGKNINSIALKVLTDLLFYSSRAGKRYLHSQLQCL
ncbi:MAG: DUF3038 domain-containing protein [Geminocystis sp.]|nr:DUF3038 domain-containing protein [Geminocystis sp.]HIK37848.1 DUF3038 domain-containing protein [Geminocystis sp. M7585_C2015_104]MCS7146948.1 DUF3038 domain-containing protein [Geminocystis sp.]MCX8077260.1 DUF3038 domain-containing protein [Geminocystis sp.]MDW8115772.1 DUF3038 domain-containing protein [Geminocystis sp.]